MYLEAFVQYFMQVAARRGIRRDEVRQWAIRRAAAVLREWLSRLERELV